MRLSVIICTRNRARSLTRTLDSIARCALPRQADDWELLVVDNSSGHELRGQWGDRYPGLPLRLLHEPRPGLSNARNLGARAARGDWLVWTDDDVTVDRAWLAEYAGAIEQFPAAKVFGGPIIPALDGHPPAWLTAGQAHIRSAFASREVGDVPDPFSGSGSLPYGANFAVRRVDALRYPFAAELGRHPRRPTRGGEETVAIRQILGSDGHGRWLPGAVVTHHIDASRQTARYIRSYYRDVGHVRQLLARHETTAARPTWRTLSKALLAAARAEALLALASVTGTDADRAARLRRAALRCGEARAQLESLLGHQAISPQRTFQHE